MFPRFADDYENPEWVGKEPFIVAPCYRTDAIMSMVAEKLVSSGENELELRRHVWSMELDNEIKEALCIKVRELLR